MYSEAEKYNNQITEAFMKSSSAQQFLTPGRVIVVKSQSVSSYMYLLKHLNEPGFWCTVCILLH